MITVTKDRRGEVRSYLVATLPPKLNSVRTDIVCLTLLVELDVTDSELEDLS